VTDKNTQPREQAAKLQRFNMRGGLMNPEPWGLYVRYEDVAALATRQAAPEAPKGQWTIEQYGMRGELCKVYDGKAYDGATKISEGYTTELKALVDAHNASTGAAPEAPTLTAAECARALALLKQFDQHVFLSPEDKALKDKLSGAAPEAPDSEQQSDEEAYAQSGYRHFMSLEKFKDFRAGVIPAVTTASASVEEFLASEFPSVEDLRSRRDPAPSRDTAGIRSWTERLEDIGTFGSLRQAMQSEIDDLRAALTQQGAAQAQVRPLDDPKMAAYLRNEPAISAYIETLECELRKAQAAHAGADTERLDWLDENIFSREMDDFDRRMYRDHFMWVLFAPKDTQGTARRIIDAAMSAATEAKEQK
jgi:hypothetical protein